MGTNYDVTFDDFWVWANKRETLYPSYNSQGEKEYFKAKGPGLFFINKNVGLAQAIPNDWFDINIDLNEIKIEFYADEQLSIQSSVKIDFDLKNNQYILEKDATKDEFPVYVCFKDGMRDLETIGYIVINYEAGDDEIYSQMIDYERPFEVRYFWAWEEAYEKGFMLLNGLQPYFQPEVFKKLVYNLVLHYCITTDFEYNGTQNPLYTKYDIASSGKGIIAHASDVSSSVTRVITDAMQKLDFIGMDLISTPYGRYAYSILTSVNITPVLL